MNIKFSIAAAALMLSAPVFAADDAIDAATVVYSDLDLSSDNGLAQLERRVYRAARQVCGPPMMGAAEQQRVSICRDNVIAQANAGLQPILAAAGRSDIRFVQNLARPAR